MKTKYIQCIQCIFILYLILILVQDKYFYLLPTIPIYPNNKNEIKIVQQYVENRTQSDIDFFRKTDRSVAFAFDEYVNESIHELRKITNNYKVIFLIRFLKNFFNRARPYQIDPNLNVLYSISAHTPAYPSGHAFQAYYLAKVLSIRYPKKEVFFHELAEKCSLARIYGGVHYPSDNAFSKKLVTYFFDFI